MSKKPKNSAFGSCLLKLMVRLAPSVHRESTTSEMLKDLGMQVAKKTKEVAMQQNRG